MTKKSYKDGRIEGRKRSSPKSLCQLGDVLTIGLDSSTNGDRNSATSISNSTNKRMKLDENERVRAGDEERERVERVEEGGKKKLSKKRIQKDKARKLKESEYSDQSSDDDGNGNGNGYGNSENEGNEGKPEWQMKVKKEREWLKESLKTNKKKSKKERLKTQALTTAQLAAQKLKDAADDLIGSLPGNSTVDESEVMLQPRLFNLGYSGPASVDSKDAMSELKLLRKSLATRVSGNAPPPLHPLQITDETPWIKDLHIPSVLQKYYNKMKYSSLTPVQSSVIPALLLRKSLVALAPTGSGKTLSYSLPLVLHAQQMITTEKRKTLKANEGARAVVLVPTRELAMQVAKEIKTICRALGNITLTSLNDLALKSKGTPTEIGKIKVAALYGGSDNRVDQTALFAPLNPVVHIITATPGRLLDLISANILTIRNVSFLVLDEGDKLLKLGFKEQVDAVYSQCAGGFKNVVERANGDLCVKQVCVFSATLGGEVKEGVDRWVGEKGVVIKVGGIEEVVEEVVEEEVVEEEKGEKVEKKEKKEKKDKKERKEKKEKDEASTFSLLIGKPSPASASPITSPLSPSPSPPPSPEADEPPKTNNNKNKITSLSKIPSHVSQIIHVCSEHKKPAKLLKTLQKLNELEKNSGGGSRQGSQCMVFFGRIEKLKSVALLLQKANQGFGIYHGQIPQKERELVVTNFKAGKIRLLLCSDIAARGLHVKKLAYVINYDFPTSLEQYVHRCGRAGRGSEPPPSTPTLKTASVYSFFTRNLKVMAPDLWRVLKVSGEWIDPNLVEICNEVEPGLIVEESGWKKRRGKSKKGREESDEEGEEMELEIVSTDEVDENKSEQVQDDAEIEEESDDDKNSNNNGEGGEDDDEDCDFDAIDNDGQFRYLGKSAIIRRDDISSASESEDEE